MYRNEEGGGGRRDGDETTKPKTILKITRLVYQLAGTPNFIEDLVSKHNLRPTQICEKFLEEQAQKVTEIDPTFYRTPAMTEGEWKMAGYELRHLYTQGFHQRICSRNGFHNADSECGCQLCKRPPIRMHTKNFTNLTLCKGQIGNHISQTLYTLCLIPL